jgi:hypothetical protein
VNAATLAPLGISEHGPVGCHRTQTYDTAGNLHSRTGIYRNTGVDSLDELVRNQTPEMDFLNVNLVCRSYVPVPRS